MSKQPFNLALKNKKESEAKKKKKAIGKDKSSDQKSLDKKGKGSKRKQAEEDHQAETKDNLTTEPESKNQDISGPNAVGKKQSKTNLSDGSYIPFSYNSQKQLHQLSQECKFSVVPETILRNMESTLSHALIHL